MPPIVLSSLPPYLIKNPKVLSLLTRLLPGKLLCSDLLALNCFGIGAGGLEGEGGPGAPRVFRETRNLIDIFKLIVSKRRKVSRNSHGETSRDFSLVFCESETLLLRLLDFC